MKMTMEQIQSMLNKAVEGVGVVKPVEKQDNAEVAALKAQIDTITKMAANGFEAPETVEDKIAKALAPITAALTEITKKVTPQPTEDEQPVQLTKKALNDLIAEAVKAAVPTTKEAVKGAGKDSSTDDDAGADEAVELDGDIFKNLAAKGIEVTSDLMKETHDRAGNLLSKQQIVDRASLDNFFGSVISRKSAASVNAEDVEVEE